MAEPSATLEAITRRDPDGNLLREVRLGLVLNGGVSLAIWIGGVTHEIDCLRRASEAPAEELAERKTSARYRELLGLLRQRVLVDVCAGASAGGINGSLLAAAVYAERPLPSLREIWITLGDFSKLLRSPSRREPPSLMLGDEVALRKLREVFSEILAAADGGPSDQPIYLYVTATDFYGEPLVLADSRLRRFQETDHRRVFVFQHPSPDPAGVIEAEAIAAPADGASGGMPAVATFELANAAELLARAARSSSSFPVAFEAHGMPFAGGTRHWMIDGGILDNQPFNPLLNRIATIDGGDVPVRRVVGYVVPYVTEVAASGAGAVEGGQRGGDPLEQPTALKTAGAASSLPRDLPKLDGLKRIVRELSDGRRARGADDRFEAFAKTAALGRTARAFFDSYRRTMYADSLETFASWASPQFRPGAGEIGQMEAIDPEDAMARPETERVTAEEVTDPPTGLLWLPDRREWKSGDRWTWGLSPSERIAAEALLHLRGLLLVRPDDAALRDAKGLATLLVKTARAMKFRVSVEFLQAKGTLMERAAHAHAGVVEDLTASFANLAEQLKAIDGAPTLQRLIDEEIVRNAFNTERRAVPPVFDFIHMSAGVRNSLGHADKSPETKLVGMQLGHFAGFLKRSWRANDWLWGRLDGVEYAISAILDVGHLEALPDREAAFAGLAAFAFPPEHATVLADAWARTLNFTRTRQYVGNRVGLAVDAELKDLPNGLPAEQFTWLLRNVVGPGDPYVRVALLDCCRAALVARIQLEILEEELPEVAAAIQQDLDNGANRGSSGAEWARRPTGSTAQERVTRFRSLHLGAEEKPLDEASSRLGIDVASAAAAVAAAAFSGSRGGLPLAVRGPLATLRGLTLVLHTMVRLLVRTPALGIAAVLVATAALTWALIRPNVLLAAAVPALAAAVIGGATVLITMATSPLEGRVRTGWQRVAFVLILATPLALLALLLGLPFGSTIELPWLGDAPLATGDPRGWLSEHAPARTIDVAIWLVAAAEVAAILRLLAGRRSRRLRVVDLWIYRWLLLLAAAVIAIGIIYERIRANEARWQGVILMLLLIGAISLAPLVAELASGLRWTAQRVKSAESWRRGFLSQSFLETGVWILLFALLIPAAVAGCLVGRETRDRHSPAVITPPAVPTP